MKYNAPKNIAAIVKMKKGLAKVKPASASESMLTAPEGQIERASIAEHINVVKKPGTTTHIKMPIKGISNTGNYIDTVSTMQEEMPLEKIEQLRKKKDEEDLKKYRSLIGE